MAYCERVDLKWQAKKLYFKGEFQLSIVEDETYIDMWRIQFSDGELSDMYNFIRVKENAVKYTVLDINKTMGPG